VSRNCLGHEPRRVFDLSFPWSGKKSLDCGADILSAQDIVAGGMPALKHIEHCRIIFLFCRLVISLERQYAAFRL
ncbi:MAG TPA: hypothetical protein PK360_10595, partial [bacterium]|nr:hypothetical protein [bacterium]